MCALVLNVHVFHPMLSSEEGHRAARRACEGTDPAASLHYRQGDAGARFLFAYSLPCVSHLYTIFVAHCKIARNSCIEPL